MLGLPKSSKSSPNPFCEWCCASKLKRTPYPKESVTRASQPIYRMFTDLSGRKRKSLANFEYYELFVDDCTRKVWVYFLKTKAECPSVIARHIKMVEREKAPLKVAFVRTDGAKEFTSTALEEVYKGEIQAELSAPHSQSQNGVVERYMGIVGNCSMAMLLRASSPSYDWVHAVNHAVVLINYTTTSSLNNGMSPNEAYDGIKRLVDALLRGVFGCLCMAKNFVRRKAEVKAIRCSYLGWSTRCKAFIVRKLDTFSGSLSEFYSRDVQFLPEVFPYKNALVPRPVSLPRPEHSDDSDEFEDVEEIPSYSRVKNAVPNIPDESEDDSIPKGSEDDAPTDLNNGDEHGYGSDDLVYEVDDEFDEKHVSEAENDETAVQAVPQLRRSNRAVTLTDSSMQRMVDNDVTEFGYQLAVVEHDFGDPVTQKQAYDSPFKEEWISAEIDEMASIYFHKVGKLVRREEWMNVMGCRFLYKAKRDAKTRVVKRRKARLVAQGFKQVKGVDYDKTFASQTKLSTVKIILFLANMYDLDLFTFDIKTFFLYGEMQEQVFMEQPPGYAEKDSVMWVWQLLKTLYGCKQSPREAGKKLKSVLTKDCGLVQNKLDPNAYMKFDDANGVLLMGNFVDDTMCAVSKEGNLKQQFLTELRKHFELEVVDDPKDFLGFEIDRDRQHRKIRIHQTGFIAELLTKYQMSDCRPLKTPWVNVKFPPPSTVELQACYMYQELVGALIWTLHTRKDLCFYLSVLCRYMSRYSKVQWELGINVLRYLAGTRDLGLLYDLSQVPLPLIWGEGVKLLSWVDSNFAERESDSKSSSGLVFQLNDCTIDANCILQKRPAQDTAEAEWYGFASMCKWTEYFRNILIAFRISIVGPTTIRHDNQAVISLVEDNSKLGRTLHWRIAQHYPRYLYDTGVIVIQYWPTDKMCADMQNKALPFPAMSKHRKIVQGE